MHVLAWDLSFSGRGIPGDYEFCFSLVRILIPWQFGSEEEMMNSPRIVLALPLVIAVFKFLFFFNFRLLC